MTAPATGHKANSTSGATKRPIATLQAVLLNDYDVTEDELLAIQNEVMAEVDAAAKFADESPDPALDSLYDHIYPGVIGEVN